MPTFCIWIFISTPALKNRKDKLSSNYTTGMKMKDLEKLKTDSLVAKQEHAECMANIHKKTEEIQNLKNEVSELTPRLKEVERLINNAKKGIGMDISINELTALKKEFVDKSHRLDELKEFIPLMQNSLKSLNDQSTAIKRHVRYIKDQMTDIIADKAAAEIVLSSNKELKELTHSTMALHGFNFSGKTDDCESLYKKIGEKICKQLYSTENKPFQLPTIQQAMVERDEMLEKIA